MPRLSILIISLTMKYIIWSLCLLYLLTAKLEAQDFRYPLNQIKRVSVSSESTIMIKSHDSPTLLIKERENAGRKRPDKAAGLNAVFSEGEDNTGYGVEISVEQSTLMVTGLLNEYAAELVLYLPRNMDIYVKSMNRNDIIVDGFTSEVVARNNRGEIILTNLTGPIVAENGSGNVNIRFSELSQSSPTSIVVVSGDIDISMPLDAQVNITSKVNRGEFYTDFDINPIFEGNDRTNARKVVGKLNDGGVGLFLHNLKGDIYLRKPQ